MTIILDGLVVVGGYLYACYFSGAGVPQDHLPARLHHAGGCLLNLPVADRIIAMDFECLMYVVIYSVVPFPSPDTIGQI